MNICYGLSLLTFLLLLVGLGQSFWHFFIFQAGHLTFMLLTSILYLLTETLVIFFFVGTGVSIKEYCLEHKLDAGFHKRSLAVKYRVYPPLLLNILLMIILFVSVGAMNTHQLPVPVYQILFLICLAHFIQVKIIEHRSFKENTQIILDMSGIKRTV
ncbi:MAG: hypothetical protein HZA28_06055 [Candidatus Omnitrophica bacterium]|nr:hypothetical protein [Candidatus Omnitrophota bacterium]